MAGYPQIIKYDEKTPIPRVPASAKPPPGHLRVEPWGPLPARPPHVLAAMRGSEPVVDPVLAPQAATISRKPPPRNTPSFDDFEPPEVVVVRDSSGEMGLP
jgi:hypothetical protein